MAVYRRSARSRYTLLLLVLTSVTLLTLDFRGEGSGVIDRARDLATEVIAPVQAASDWVFSPVGDFVGGIVHYGDVRAENKRLRIENQQLRGEVLRADDAERERQALLAEHDIDFVGDIPRVTARVVATSSSNFELTVEIDKGTSDGIADGMPVVSGAGLVGRVVDVARTRSTVLLITDRQSSVGVRVTPSGDVGVARGAGFGRPLPVDLIDPSTPVEKGDVLVTSGLQQSAFPPGIPVGEVVRAAVREGELVQRVAIEPVVDLGRLSFLTVLQWGRR